MKIKIIYYLTIFFFSLSLMTPSILFDPSIGYEKIKVKYRWLTPQLYNFIYYESRRFNVPIEKICAIIQSESEGDPRAISKSKARGLMQIMPCHYQKGDVSDLYDPKLNIYLGTKYYKWCEQFSKGNMERALMAYNAGPALSPGMYPKKLYEDYVLVIIDNYKETKRLMEKPYIIR